MKIEQRKSIALERDSNGIVNTLIIKDEQYEFDGRVYIIPEEVAESVDLLDLDFPINIIFDDRGENGNTFRAIRNTKGKPWVVVMMVRHTLKNWNRLKSITSYAHDVEDAVKQREESTGDVTLLETHICEDHFHIVFSGITTGVTVKDLLDNFRKLAAEILPLLI